MPEIKERPILFSAPMVRAILEGRKTVTRREVKKQAALDCLAAGFEPAFLALPGNADLCPYGQPGDQLWVRETWGVISHDFDELGNMIDWLPDRPATPIREMPFGRGYYSGHVIYRADGEAEWAGDDDGGGETRSAWKPSIHMPRKASRILLEITAVRVERMQDGEGETAHDSRYLAEGINRIHHGDGQHYYHAFKNEPGLGNWVDPFDAWRELWVEVNGADSWNANPWVWVVEFQRVAL
ncbi:hypothetical protein M2401_000866 [Pseudomonas sp. JUb42]|uniref:hypothetical protein n=1 Tax=Pseudomonas sp. JUb42 TaxID=2940611 RepID=UPI0021692023|nr:hypothetical protein [Pseudomonas sp. JUb42]MCS3467145.1 hypothetical protein [Pseudomonas sp. JUb42]